jgi:GT2 family glycosyltransferase
MGDQQKKELKLSIIIPTYYRYDCLAIVLDLLEKQTVKPFEVIAVDQTPLDERPEAFYEKFKSLPLKVLNLKKPSCPYAKNEGAKAARGDVILFLDDDIEFEKDLIEKYLSTIIEENVDVVVGSTSRTKTLDDKNIYYNRDYKLLDPLMILLKSRRGKWDGMVFGIIGGNTMIKRDLFLKTGGFDEIIPRMEDTDLGYRLLRSGARMIRNHRLFLHHKKMDRGGTSKTQKNMLHVRLVSKFYLYKKHFPGWVTDQLLIREILNAITFRTLITGHFSLRYLINPFRPFIQLYVVSKAWRESGRLLKKSNSREIK